MKTYEVDVEGKTYEVDAPDTNTAWQWANQTHRAAQVKLEEAGRAMGGQYKIGAAGLPQAARQVAEESGPIARAGKNVLLGAHTLGEALDPIGALFRSKDQPSASPEELRQSKLIKQGFAESVPGGEYYQLAGEVAPTLIVPGGAYSTAARMAGRTLPMSLAARAGDIALTGAATGALTTPGGVEERVGGALGGAVGGAVPIASAGAKGAYRMVRPSVAGRAAGREAGIAERIARDLGEEKTGELVGKLDTPTEEFTRAGVKQPTAAQLTRDPALQQLETGLRVQRPDLFKAIDDAAATGRWDELAKIAQNEEALAAKMQERSAATDTLREGALAAASQVKGFEAPVAQAVEGILTGPSRTIPQAKTLATWVKGELEQGVTPEQLYSMRKSLTSGIPHGTELGSAMTQARRERMALVEAIDKALNDASGGEWGKYMDTYAEMSKPVTQMKAGQAMQQAFETTSNRTAEGVPVMTPRVLRRALEKHGEKQFGSKTVERITPEQRATIEAIARSSEAEIAARMAQGTVGSATAGNVAAANRVIDTMTRGALHAATGGMVPGAIADVAGSLVGHPLKRAREKAYAELLSDPERLRRALMAASGTVRREDVLGREAARFARPLPGAAAALE